MTEKQKMQTTRITLEIRAELDRAMLRWPSMKSAHEGYAVILEELEELWELVRVKTDQHDYAAMEKEAIQIGAMAARFVLDLIWSRNEATQN